MLTWFNATPSQPHYARAIARYLVAEYKLHLYPYDDLVIYELGAGSGSLAQDVLRYIRDEEPEIYARTRYRIIEISARLATQQRARLAEHENVEIVNQSFLEWEDDVPEPCFVIALEVLVSCLCLFSLSEGRLRFSIADANYMFPIFRTPQDNFAHDVVRYSTATLQPYQALVSIDHTGDMHELWEPAKDPLISRYLSLRQAVRPSALPPSAPFYLRLFPSLLRSFLSEKMPLYPNLTPPHYVPTGALRFLDVLRRRFPLHRLVLSDFDALPDALEGVDAPVVQTRFKRTMIPVTNYRVLQGFFDIFFPTNFELLRDVYGAVMASSPSPKSGSEVPVPPSRTSRNVAGAGAAPPKGPASPRPSPLATSSSLRPDYFSASAPLRAASASAFAHESSGAALARRNTVKIYSHADFLSRFAEVERTRTRDGANPMVGWYANAKFFCS